MRKIGNLLFLIILLFIGCTPKAFKIHNKKLNFLLTETREESLTYSQQIDTIRIVSKDTLMGIYHFSLGARYSGKSLILKQQGRFKDYQSTDVVMMNFIHNLRSRYGKWKLQKNGVISFRYLLGVKKYKYLSYRYHENIFLVSVKGVDIFCNRIKQKRDSFGNINRICLLDSTAIIKYR